MGKDYYTVSNQGFRYWNETDRGIPAEGWLKKKFIHYGYFYRVNNLLAELGFDMKPDSTVGKSIRKDYYIGCRGNLEIRGHKFPNGFEYTFKEYQGEGKITCWTNEFSYLEGLRTTLILKKIKELVAGLGDFEDCTRLYPKDAEEWIKCRYAEEWHHKQKDTNFNLRDLDGQEQPSYNGRDRDGKTLRNGEIKYFRYYDGYLRRGRIYHNINNMWWVIANKMEVRNVACFELFDLTPEDKRGRQVRARIPEEYAARIKAIGETKTKELISELRRRGVKVG